MGEGGPETLPLLFRLGGNQILGGSEVREQAGQTHAFERLVMFQERRQPVRRHPQAPQSGVHFEMELDGAAVAAGALGVGVKPGSGGNGRRELKLDEVRRVAHIEAAQQQDGLRDPCGSQFQGFFDAGHSEPIHAALGQTIRHRHGSVTVGVRLDDGHHFAPAGKAPDSLIIPAQF